MLACWFVALVVAVNLIVAKLQAASPPDLPFGIFSSHGTVYAQDFSYNLLFFHGVEQHLVAHPYRLEDQERLMRRILPGMDSGMSHAYSPVAFVLTQPLLVVSGRSAFLIFSVLSGVGTLLLFYFYLLPRANDTLQLCTLAVCALSVWTATTFLLGQTSPLTTALLGGFWALLIRRPVFPSLLRDVCLGLLFWALCLKPSIAILPLMLLLGARAWRPLFLGTGLLLLTWLAAGGYYGGWWSGLSDYAYLLNHYHNADFTPFMQRGSENPGEKHLTELWFSLDRNLILILSLTLLFLRWSRRITGSEQFQGLVWSFLLFSPYLLPSENWILCLLVVEGTFFKSKSPFQNYGRLLLMLGLFNLRAEVNFPVQIEFPLKCFLFAWVAVEFIRNLSSRRQSDLARVPSPGTKA